MTTTIEEPAAASELSQLADMLEAGELDLEFDQLPHPTRLNIVRPPQSKLPIQSDRDQWYVKIMDQDGAEIDDYPAFWTDANPFAESPRVMVAGEKLTRAERRLLLEGFEEQAAVGLHVPRLVVPHNAHTIEIRKDHKVARPGNIYLARWLVVPLTWEPQRHSRSPMAGACRRSWPRRSPATTGSGSAATSYSRGRPSGLCPGTSGTRTSGRALRAARVSPTSTTCASKSGSRSQTSQRMRFASCRFWWTSKTPTSGTDTASAAIRSGQRQYTQPSWSGFTPR